MMEREYTRRETFGIFGGLVLAAATGRVFFEPRPTSAQTPEYSIVPLEYEPAYGRQSLPWGSAQEIVNGEWDSAFDKYDATDIFINGWRARSAYWKPTKVWMEEQWGRILRESTHRPSTGACQDAAVSSWFAPVIEGDIEIPQTGIKFTEIERRRIGALSFGGLYRYPEFERTRDAVSDLQWYYNEGHCVVVNRSLAANQDWWGVVVGFEGNNFVVSIPAISPQERGEQIEVRTPQSLHNAAVIQSTEYPHPERYGNFNIIDRNIGGLIIVTRQLV